MENYLYKDVYQDVPISASLAEICVVAYSVTKQEARIYSKYMAKYDPDIYDMNLFDAASATSSAPLYWELKQTKLPGGDSEVLIDGGVIENNPAIYAESLALIRHMQNNINTNADPATVNHRPIRMISIGTGGSPLVN